jgi:hypothetical protein
MNGVADSSPPTANGLPGGHRRVQRLQISHRGEWLDHAIRPRIRGRRDWLALLRLVSNAAVLAISAPEDSSEGKILVKRRPVQAKRRDLDAAKINLFRPLQTRVAFRWKAHLMATREPDEDQAAVMPCL